MSQVSQKEAVYSAVISTLGDSFTPNTTLNLTKEQRSEIQTKVASALTAGTVSFRKPEMLQNAEYVKTYVIGLVSNWVRRDPRFKPAIVTKAPEATVESSATAE